MVWEWKLQDDAIIPNEAISLAKGVTPRRTKEVAEHDG